MPSPDPEETPTPIPPSPSAQRRSEALEAELAMLESLLSPEAPAVPPVKPPASAPAKGGGAA